MLLPLILAVAAAAVNGAIDGHEGIELLFVVHRVHERTQSTFAWRIRRVTQRWTETVRNTFWQIELWTQLALDKMSVLPLGASSAVVNVLLI